MSLLLFVIGIALVMAAARGLEDNEPRTESSGWADALLFLLCLVGVIAAQRKRASDDEC